jgi:hypothetical protein
MEPRREEVPKAPPPGAEQKPKRFRIVKLEERIAPSNGGTHGHCRTNTCGGYFTCYACW